MFLQNVLEGYFSDPIYGGNKDMAAWKMIGFPGARYDYLEWVTRHGERVLLSARRHQRPPRLVGGLAHGDPTCRRSMRCWSASDGPGRSWLSSCAMRDSRCSHLERGEVARYAHGFRDHLRAGRTALHVAPSPVSGRRPRYADAAEQCAPAGPADAPPGLVPVWEPAWAGRACTGTHRSGASWRAT